jgi:hypothetical protein
MAGNRRLVWGGVAFGFAMAINLWAVIPLAIVGLLLARWPRRVAALAAGAAAGLIVLVLPFLAAAPGRLIKDTITSQATKADQLGLLNRLTLLGRWQRMKDLAGLAIFHAFPARGGAFVLLTIVVAVLATYMMACVFVGRLPAPLDWYALIGALAVIILFLWPQLYYPHYGAFEGPFLALALALPVGLLRPAESRIHLGAALAVGMTAAVLVAGVSLWQVGSMTRYKPLEMPSAIATADRLIPPGSCVVTNEASVTIVANRFISNVPGCPSVVDSYGTFLALTDGWTSGARPPVIRAAVRTWETWLARADYLWIDPAGSGGQLPWTPAFYSYIVSHFTLIALPSHRPAHDNIPRGGLYQRR